MNSYVVIPLALVVLACQVLSQDQFYGFNEPACIQLGGQCIQSSQCESFVSGAGAGLCAAQKSLGFECCYGLPKSETRCWQRGGECFKKNYCAPALWYRAASDCGSDEECCILL